MAALVAPQVALLVEQAARDREMVEESPPPLPAQLPSELLEIGEVLALDPEPSQATRRVADLAGRFLPFDELHFALRLSEGDRVVLLDPGERRQLPDLPSVPVAGTALGQVLQGELPHLFALARGVALSDRIRGHARGGAVARASRFLTGLVTCFATHDGTPDASRAACRR